MKHGDFPWLSYSLTEGICFFLHKGSIRKNFTKEIERHQLDGLWSQKNHEDPHEDLHLSHGISHEIMIKIYHH
jgi:hypothetical protein